MGRMMHNLLKSSKKRLLSIATECIFVINKFSGMWVIGRATRPLPVPGPWGLPGPYQVYAGTRLKTTEVESPKVGCGPGSK